MQWNNAELVHNLSPYFIRPGESINALSITQSVLAGDGLTGGGVLTTDVTLNVGEGNGLDVTADAVAVKLPASSGLVADGTGTYMGTPSDVTTTSTSSLSGSTHAHYIDESAVDPISQIVSADASGYVQLVSLTAAASVTIDPTGSVFLDPGSLQVNPVDNYETSLGQINKKYLTLHVAELWSDTLVANETIATIGGRILVAPTSRLARDLGSSDTTIYVEHNSFAQNDIIYMEKDLRVEFMVLTSTVTNPSNQMANFGFEIAGVGGADIWDTWIENAGDGALANETVEVEIGVDAAKMTAGASADTYVYQTVVVTAQTRYRLKFWTRGDGTYSGQFKVTDESNGTDIIALRSCGNASITYIQKIVYLTTPVGCTSLRYYLYCPETNGGIAYFDNGTSTLYGGVPFGKAEWSYTVTRNLDGTGANDWEQGDAVVNTGQTGSGWIDLYSVEGVNSNGTGPTIVGNVRTAHITPATDYNAWVEGWAIGNLDGLYNQTDVYGVGLGEYQTGHQYSVITGNSIKFYDYDNGEMSSWSGQTIILGGSSDTERLELDPTNGVRIYGNSLVVGQWDTAGDLFLGEIAADQANVWFDNSADSLFFRVNTTRHFVLDGSYGGAGNVLMSLGSDLSNEDNFLFTVVAAGTPTLNAETLGAGDVLIGTNDVTLDKANIFFDYSAGIWEFRQGQGAAEVYIDTDGSLAAGGGNVLLYSAGIEVDVGTSFSTDRSYKVVSNTYSGTCGYVSGWYSSNGTVAYEIMMGIGTTHNIAVGRDEAASPQYYIELDSIGGISLLPSATEVVYINERLFINEAVNTEQTYGITINQDSATDEMISLKADNITHGMSWDTETDTVGALKQYINDAGGLVVAGWSEGSRAVRIRGVGLTESTVTSTSGIGAINLQAVTDSTGASTLGNTANLATVRNYTTTRFIFKGDGKLYVDVGQSVTPPADPHTHDQHIYTYDEFDDVKLLAGIRGAMIPKDVALRESFGEFVDYARPVLEETKLLIVNDGQYGNEDDGSVFMDLPGMVLLNNDAIRQSYHRSMARIDQLEQALLAAGISVPASKQLPS